MCVQVTWVTWLDTHLVSFVGEPPTVSPLVGSTSPVYWVRYLFITIKLLTKFAILLHKYFLPNRHITEYVPCGQCVAYFCPYIVSHNGSFKSWDPCYWGKHLTEQPTNQQILKCSGPLFLMFRWLGWPTYSIKVVVSALYPRSSNAIPVTPRNPNKDFDVIPQIPPTIPKVHRLLNWTNNILYLWISCSTS